MRNIPFIILFLLLTISANHIAAQTFKGGLTAGANFTQIDGDNIGGYTKLGINAGVMSDIALNDKWSLVLELLYSQKGSAASYTFSSYQGPLFKIKLHYADIPILIRYHDLIGGLTFGAGISVGKLITHQYTEDGIDYTDQFDNINKPKPWELDVLGDLTYMFTPVWGINLRMAYSVLPIRIDCNGGNNLMPNCGQYSNVISLRTIFLFSAINQKRVANNE